MSGFPQSLRVASLFFLAFSLVVLGSSAHEKSPISAGGDTEIVTADRVAKTAKIPVTLASFVAQTVTFDGAGENFVDGGAEELPPPAEVTPDYPQAEVAKSCYLKPHIIYRQRIRANKFYGCDPPENAVMIVEHPGCGCSVEVPVCLPACLEGVPTLKSRCTPSGRGIVNFCWSNGFNLKVIFRVKGDLVVTYMPIIQ